MRSARLQAASAATVLMALLLPALLLPSASSANAGHSPADHPPAGHSFAADFDREVYGDFSTIGNTVTACPPGERARACRESEQGRADVGEESALNNGNAMVWTDVDADPDTYDSSSARLSIPAGARIAFAKLTWAGDLRAGSTGVCGRSARWPSGSPEGQPVSLTVGSRPTVSISPGRFAMDKDFWAVGGDRWYSAHADVTRELAGVRGAGPSTVSPSTVTVGNIWTGQGHDCFGGWSLVVVWSYDGPNAEHAPARKRVVVYDGHLRVPVSGTRMSLGGPGLRAAGSPTRLGITAYEGDLALDGDALLVNGRALAEPSHPGRLDNFFVSSAEGASDPRHVNNMSVDAKSFGVSADAAPPWQGVTELTFGGSNDTYLVQSIAASFGHPELSISTSTDRPVAHQGDRITQTATVRNIGGAPAENVTVGLDIGAGCVRPIGTLGAGKGTTVSCTGRAAGRDYDVTAKVTGAGQGGKELSARSTSSIRVLHPALRTELRVSKRIAVPDEPLHYDIVLYNEGNATLTGLAVRGADLTACERHGLAALPAGKSRALRCRIEVGRSGGSKTVTVSGKDELGREVSDSATVAFSVVRPSVTLRIVGPTVAVPPHGLATLTVRIRNTSPVPLDGVRVTGKPTPCDQRIGRLAPAEPFVYACRVRVERDFRVTLTVSGTPVIGGRPIDTRYSVRSFGSILLAAQATPSPPARPETPVRQQPPAVARPPAPRPPAPKETDQRENDQSMIPVAGIIAGLATTVMLVSVAAFSSALRAK